MLAVVVVVVVVNVVIVIVGSGSFGASFAYNSMKLSLIRSLLFKTKF